SGVRVGAFLWGKLPLAFPLEGAFCIVPNRAGAGGKDCSFDIAQRIDRHVHTPLINDLRGFGHNRSTRSNANELRELVIDSRTRGISIGVRGKQCNASANKSVDDLAFGSISRD